MKGFSVSSGIMYLWKGRIDGNFAASAMPYIKEGVMDSIVQTADRWPDTFNSRTVEVIPDIEIFWNIERSHIVCQSGSLNAMEEYSHWTSLSAVSSLTGAMLLL